MKARFLALAALVLGLASCQTEPEGLDVNVGGAVDTTITVSIPETETRYGENSNSAGSVFTNGVLSANDVTMRYIFQVYYNNGDQIVESQAVPQVKYSDDKSVNFGVRLVPDRDYTFVVWADVVKKDQQGNWADLHYNTRNDEGKITLNNITVNEDKWVAMDESRDAFTVTKVIEDYTGTSEINLELKRPLAKLRVKTTDMKVLKDLQIKPTYATVEYTSDLYNTFNAVDGTVSGTMRVSETGYEIAAYSDNDSEGDEQSMILFTDYVFAPKDQDGTVRFDLTVYDEYGADDDVNRIKYNSFSTDIKTHRNYLTTISGNILTDGNKIEVEVKDAFENVNDNGNTTDPNYEYKTISSDNEFLAALTTPGKYVVISDLHVAKAGDTVNTLATRAGDATTTIDLNGKTITVENKGTGALASVAAGNILVITNTVDGGKIELTEGSTGAFIKNNGTVVIENGNIKSNSTNNAPVIDNNGTTNITGGVIGDNAVENTENGDVNITGGKLEGDDFDDFIDDDYTKNENNEIVMKPTIAKIGEVGYTSLQKAVAAVQDGETITLVANETFTEKNYYDNGGWKDGLGYAGDKSFTIDLGNFTISQNGALNDYLIWIKNDGSKANTITLKNGTLDAGTSAYCALATSSSNAQKITINLEDIELIGNNSSGAVAKIRGGSELNVKAGTVITGKNNYVGIEAVGNNTVVNIYEGAEIYQNGTDSYVGAIVGASYNATMNIYGGYGKSAKCGIIVMSTGATINVSGGEWIANNDGTVANDNNAVLVSQNNRYETGWACKSILNVTGGTFKGGYNCYGMGPGVEPNDAQINIKGGNFNANPASYVVAGYESVEENGVYTVGLPEALVKFLADIAKGGEVTLEKNITLLENVVIEGKTVVLDLNGKTVTAPSISAFTVKADGKLTLKNGNVVAHASVVSAQGGEVVIESGEYTSTGTALDSPATYRYSLDCREGGELIINGGTFKSNNGMINVGSTVTINGGKFENIIEKTMTRHFAYVYATLTINDGEFYGKANGGAGGCFFCGAGADGDIQINGGKFTSLWTSGSVNRIFEVYFGGTINVTGGMFNTNGGIATFVTENTDEATKAAYPYVAK